jgi:hypothetical protein
MLGEDVDRYIQRARDLHYGCTYLAALELLVRVFRSLG